MLARAFSRTLRRVVACLWLLGAVIAGLTAPLAAAHESATSGLVFAAVSVALVGLAIATARAARWALILSLGLLGAQLFGALGSGWELLHGVDGRKARQLHDLGIDPTFGVTLNLLYSLLAFTVFVCAMRRAGRRTGSTSRATQSGAA